MGNEATKYQSIEYLFIGYVSKVLKNKSINYFKKKYKDASQYIYLEKVDDWLFGTTEFRSFNFDYVEQMDETKLEEYVENSILAHAIENLTEKEKQIIFYKFFKEQSDLEIAKTQGVTRQAISKKKIKILEKLATYMHI